MSEPALHAAPAVTPAAGHAHDHGSVLTLADRHTHEAETYDAMARALRDSWIDEEYLVDPARIPFVNREHVDYLSYAVAQLQPLAGKRILEVGAGSGSLAVWLAHQGAEVVGIDVSGGILDIARDRARINGVADRTRFVHCAVEEFDPRTARLGHDRYDAVIGNNVVHHFDRDVALRNIGRLLAPGAIAAFCEPVLFLPEWVRAARNSRIVTRRFPPHTHSPDERSLGKDDFAVMRKHFRHVEWTPFQLFARLQNFVELSDPVWDRLTRVDRAVLGSIPASRTLCRMVVVTLGLPREETTP